MSPCSTASLLATSTLQMTSYKHLNPQKPSPVSALLGLAPLMRKPICQVFNTFERLITS